MRAVVIGGGVAGSAGAIALARAGADVTVHEAYDDPAGPVGSFVSLAVNGLRALDSLGCLPAVQAAGFAVERQRMWSGRGRLLGDVPRGRRSDDALRSVTITRADLVEVLRREAIRCGARVVTGERVTADGPAAAGADIVVGADGIWSAARRTLDPAAPGPAYAGLYSVSGTATAAPDGAHGFNMVMARAGAFIYLPAPDGTVWWSAQVAAPREPSDLAAVGPRELRELFRDDAPVTTVLRHASGVTAATLLHVLAPVARRQDGRTVLIGDAAHPVGAGQGASMALEDAVVLGHELAAASGDGGVAAALARFDGQRHARTAKLAKSAAANRDAKTSGPVAARLREVFMPLFFNRFYERATGWLYDFDRGRLTSP
ncbi:FAD-dependent oxidoreductase [Actinomadura algeriensis]|uniref:2-polyprenyl-6-methoxyphenol hydroxylase-like FAD-dependent oxidoreductase n=1 Tax=Actinomadura algeriensis TaxID=1679523 RepID=A0ABR9JPM0_9ACTN|nr:NAD(P)/FAD-dependent oxidoreductase [Actinomadura algeriensis]MBE1532321.1 2-polyprenyl-6-methoxyphenol hydroxylase-like FAD-dependent oxidoreductase [Actinomadura algeriensis]